MFLRLRRSTPIADTAVGAVAVVSGVVEAEAELLLPETRVPCVYYEAVYEAYRSGARGRGRHLWLPDYFSRKCAGLLVRDDSGLIRIAVDVAPLVLQGAHRHSERLGRNGRRRVVARYLRAGDRVKVRGLISAPVPPGDERLLSAGRGGRLEVVVLR